MPVELIYRYTWIWILFGCPSEEGRARQWYTLLSSLRKSQLQWKPNLMAIFGKSPTKSRAAAAVGDSQLGSIFYCTWFTWLPSARHGDVLHQSLNVGDTLA